MSEASSEVHDNPQDFRSKLNTFLHKRQTIIAVMVMIGIFLFVPLLFLILSIARENRQITTDDNRGVFDVPYVNDKLIVELKADYSAQEIEELNRKFEQLGIVDQEKLSTTNISEFQNYYVLKFREGADIKSAYEELEKSGLVENIAPNYLFQTNVAPNDPSFPNMWGLARIEMQNAWEISQGSSSVVVAIIDTGIDYSHPDLSGKNVILGPDFSTCDQYQAGNATACIPGQEKPRDNDPMDEHGHGTHVAGTVGAVTNNNIGIAGVGYDVGLMAIKTMGKSSSGVYEDVFAGFEYAVNDSRVNVINMSLGLGRRCSDLPGMQEMVNQAVARGKVVVVASGNAGSDATGVSPASCSGVITVGASDENDRRAQFSNYGSVVRVAAPGVGILSTLLPGVSLSPSCSDQNYGSANDGYGQCNGTSMAAPHVAGVAALLLSQNGNLSASQVISCIVDNADSISTDRNIGPRLNAFRALNACSGIAPITPEPTIAPTSTPMPSGVLSPSPTSIVGLSPQPSPRQVQSVINGTIFIDTNNNSRKDTSEQGYPGAEIVLTPQNIRIISDSQGAFKFDNLSAGSYVISAYINGQRTHFSNIDNLQLNTMVDVFFGISPSMINQVPGQPTLPPNQSLPVIQPTFTPIPSPTPIKTYTCRERTDSDYFSQGTLQLGSLICEPN